MDLNKVFFDRAFEGQVRNVEDRGDVYIVSCDGVGSGTGPRRKSFWINKSETRHGKLIAASVGSRMEANQNALSVVLRLKIGGVTVLRR